MRASLIASVLALAISQVTADYNQSAPFTIILLSQNSTLNGASLAACHEGAAIEGLCLAGGKFGEATQFTYNTSSPDDKTGILAYQLIGGNFNVSCPMQFSYSPSSNVAMPIIIPGTTSTLVGFDRIGRMFVMRYQDDTQPLPNNEETPQFRWYICQTYYGYPYQTLVWTVGIKAPQNPTCVSAQPVRVFV
ncbi:uncharacterized protein BP5553_03145 [Venustampulla echinocandica]|uniref:DUF7907 domain-containing protein n=1 Tax=Venustampulla echinocandica TaxID=2656787 RepID=A0A370TTG0_9HELO|nr:uncharacterized protein BP5553_03145 [Venustampulla echinocandica]RDL38805.1 hypothetical protein BP5553_03145 [Venustampulla echinocandica]